METSKRDSHYNIKRIGGYSHKVIPIMDHTEKVIHHIIAPFAVELKPRDILQIIIGASVVVITKGGGIEGTAIITEDFEDILKEKQIKQDIIKKSKALVISLRENRVEEALQLLRNSNITVSCIGRIQKGKGKLLLYEGNKHKLYEKPMPEKDELAKLWRSYPRT